MFSVFSATLALSLATAGVLSGICMYPPNGPPTSASQTDRVRFMTGLLPKLGAHVSVVLFLYHALVTLYFPTTGRYHESHEHAATLRTICPHAHHLHPSVFTWSQRTMLSLLTIFVGAMIRIAAYGGLGTNFTFQLGAPDRLVTGGIYRLVQHPSYTGLFMVIVGGLGVCYQWDSAAVACWMSDATFQQFRGIAGWGAVAVAIATMVFLRIRVSDEETMLRAKFGEEWERWHRRTARFVPGIF